MLRIVADANIPALQSAFGALGTVQALPGRDLTPAAVHDADVLLVRSVTPVDAALLAGSAVRFVGSATAGTDHVDRPALDAFGVAFVHAPGSNATSVVEWVVAGLLATAAERGEGLEGRTLGVVGAGAVGGRLIPRARALGLQTVVSDPPLAAASPDAVASVPLDALLDAADIVTLHTPLTTAAESSWPTERMIDRGALLRMKRGAWLVNAARGRIVDGEALVASLDAGHLAEALLDVWPDEPAPDPALVARTRCAATPHIAGYSADGKVAGTAVLADALRQWLAAQGEPAEPWNAEAALTPDAPLVVEAPTLPAGTPAERVRWLDALARQAYDLRADTARFRSGIDWDAPPEDRAAAFAELRRTYPARREWARYRVRGRIPEALAAAVHDGLGMRTTGGGPQTMA